MNSIGTILIFFRLTELNSVASCFFIKKNASFKLNDENVNKDNKNSKTTIQKKLTFSAIINNPFLIEYMFFIFQGIYQIAKEIEYTSPKIE